MAENRTKATDADVLEFIEAFVDTAQKKQDSLALIEIMQETTGFAPKMWGSSIIGFGNYHYRSEKSKQAGDWPLVGFSPRKAAISLYVYTNEANQEALLKDLGKFKMGKACIYVKKIEDIHVDVLKKMIDSTMGYLLTKYGAHGKVL